MTNENPYEPTPPTDPPRTSASKRITQPALFVLAVVLAVVAGATFTQGGKLWIGLIFVCPAIAILISVARFGALALQKSLKFAAVFAAISIASYIAFAATCCGVNIASIENLHNFDESDFAVVTSWTTLFGCVVAFLLSKKFLQSK